MALISCSECGEQISDKAAVCPKCGAPVAQISVATVAAEPQKAPSNKVGWLLIGAFAVGLLILWGVSISNDPAAQVRMQERDAIDYCWKEQKRPSWEPEVARFMAGACEKMEADYRAKHHREP